jgi:glycopeptide antibiotics resistance protein
MQRNITFWVSAGLSQALFIILSPVWLKLLSYLHPVVLVVVWVCVTALVSFVVFCVRKDVINISSNIIKIAISLYSVGLLVLLFVRPSNQEYNQINLVPFKTIANFIGGDGGFFVAFYNISANVLLFVPFGITVILLCKNKPSEFLMIVVPVVVIIIIEGVQHLTRRGSMDVDDLILNILGVGIGYLLSSIVKKVVKV